MVAKLTYVCHRVPIILLLNLLYFPLYWLGLGVRVLESSGRNKRLSGRIIGTRLLSLISLKSFVETLNNATVYNINGSKRNYTLSISTDAHSLVYDSLFCV